MSMFWNIKVNKILNFVQIKVYLCVFQPTFQVHLLLIIKNLSINYR